MQNNPINNNADFDQTIDITELFQAVWQRKIFIIIFVSICAVSSVVYSLSLPNMYSSKVLLAPSEKQNSLSSSLGAYSSLAGIAGINMPGGGDNLSIEAMERIMSFDFFSKHFLPYIELENLFAVDKWNRNNNTITYLKNIYDPVTKTWVRKVRPPKKNVPSEQEAYKQYKLAVTVNENKKNKYVSISVTHKSPYVAKKWNDIIVSQINKSMREESQKIAQESIVFLNEAYNKTKKDVIKKAVSELIETQMQTLMLSSVSKDYVYKTIDSALIPEGKSSPNRALICIVITLIGGFLSIFISIFLHFRK